MKKLNSILIICMIFNAFKCSSMNFFRFIYSDKDVFIPTCSISVVLILPLITHNYQRDGDTFELLALTVAIEAGILVLLISLYLKQKQIESSEKIITIKDKILAVKEKEIDNLKTTMRRQKEQIESLSIRCNNLLIEKNFYSKCLL